MNVASNTQQSKGSGALAVASLLALQLMLVSWTFPVSELFSEVPLFNIDGAYHWYQIEVARELARQGRLVGYDPNFAAGYVGGVTLNASAKLQALVAICLASFVSTTVAYKLTVFSLAVLGPAMVPISAIVLRLRSRSIWIGAALGICLWWASGFRWFHTAGMSSFVFAAYLGLAYTALVLQVSTRPVSVRWILGLGLTGALGLFIHPLFPVTIALALPAFLFAFRRNVNFPSTLISLVGIAIVSAIPNLPWAVAMIGSGVSELGAQPYQRTVDLVAVFRELAGAWGPGSMGSKLFAGLLAASVYSAFYADDALTRRLAHGGLLAWLFLTLFAHLGGAVPVLGSLQPNRFSGVAYLFLLPASAAIVSQILSAARTAVALKRLTAVVVAGVVGLSVAMSMREVAREISYSPVGHYGAVPPEVRPLGPKSVWLLDWIKRKTTSDGRVLFETSKGRTHDGAHMAGYLAVKSGREFIGGPYPFMFAASAWDDHAFGKPIDAMTHAEFGEYLDLYNVGWIIAHSKAFKRFLLDAPNISAEGSFEDVSTFRVDRPLTYFLKGSGTVDSDGLNRITISSAKGGEIILKYHYVAGLHADPAIRVEPAQIPGHDGDFVRIVLPEQARVTLFLK